MAMAVFTDPTGPLNLNSLLLMSIGVLGAVLLSMLHFANQQRWIAADQPTYLVANLVGAGMVIASLPAEWNTATSLLAIVWVALSVFGLGRFLAERDEQ